MGITHNCILLLLLLLLLAARLASTKCQVITTPIPTASPAQLQQRKQQHPLGGTHGGIKAAPSAWHLLLAVTPSLRARNMAMQYTAASATRRLLRTATTDSSSDDGSSPTNSAASGQAGTSGSPSGSQKHKKGGANKASKTTARFSRSYAASSASGTTRTATPTKPAGCNANPPPPGLLC